MSPEWRRPLDAVVAVRTLLVAAVAFGLVLGYVVDAFALAALAIGGGAAFAWATAAVAADSPRRVAVGTTVLTTAPVVVLAAVAATDGRAGWVLGCLALATALVVLETFLGFTDPDVSDALFEALFESGTVALGLGTVVVVALSVASFGVLVGAVRATLEASTATTVGAFVSLQVGLLGCGLLLGGIRRLLGRLNVPSAFADDSPFASRFVVDPGGVPLWYVLALAVQAVLAAYPPVDALVGAVLSSQPVVGRVVRVALLSGALQGAVGALLCLLVLVALTLAAVLVVVSWAGSSDTPGRTVALGAGGFTVVGVVGAVGLLVVRGVVSLSSLPGWTTRGGSPLSNYLTLVLVAFAGLLALWLLLVTFWKTVEASGTAGTDGWGYTGGSVLLFGATVLTAGTAPPAVPVVGVAVVLGVWHLGRYAVETQRDLADEVPPLRLQVVQTTGLALVLAVGVAVTLAVGYYVVPAGYVVVVPSLSVADNRGTIALALGCLSVLSFLSVIVGDRSGYS